MLCLIMCASILSTNILTAYAVGTATSFLHISNAGMQNGTISFVVSVKPNVVRFCGTVLNVEFDSKMSYLLL